MQIKDSIISIAHCLCSSSDTPRTLISSVHFSLEIKPFVTRSCRALLQL